MCSGLVTISIFMLLGSFSIQLINTHTTVENYIRESFVVVLQLHVMLMNISSVCQSSPQTQEPRLPHPCPNYGSNRPIFQEASQKNKHNKFSK